MSGFEFMVLFLSLAAGFGMWTWSHPHMVALLRGDWEGYWGLRDP